MLALAAVVTLVTHLPSCRERPDVVSAARPVSRGTRAETSAEALKLVPTLSRTHIAFVAAGQLWVAGREGGTARPLNVRLDPMGSPRFSPDGRRIAYSFGHQGSFRDIYTVSIDGGPPERVTYQPDTYKVLSQWAGDGRLVYASPASFAGSGREVFTVPARGGLPLKLPIGLGTEAALSPDGQRVAFANTFRIPSWKRNVGGMAPDLWGSDLSSRRSERLTTWKGIDAGPVWHGHRLYYLSDAGSERRLNIWVLDPTTGPRRQVTHYADYDVDSFSLGPGPDGKGEIVLQRAGDLYLMALDGSAPRRVSISLPEETERVARREVDAARFINTAALSPKGERVALEARGDVWLLGVSAAGGSPINLTHTDGVCERDPSWSPDGMKLAYFSDASGEYELYVRTVNGGTARKLTSLGPGFRYGPTWSPDGSHIAFTDHTGGVWVCDVGSATVKQVDKDPLSMQSRLQWSPDSRRIVYHKNFPTGMREIWSYACQTGALSRLTTGMTRDSLPTFDPRGGRFYFVSARDYSSPVLDAFDRGFAYPTTGVIVRVEASDDDLFRQAEATGPAAFERREMVLPVPSGRFANLFVLPDGRLVYLRMGGGPPTVCTFDPATSREEKVFSGADDTYLSQSGKLLVASGGSFVLVDLTSGGTPQGVPASTANMRVTVDPRAEWAQMFEDEWRFARDFFYATDMHGVDWSAQRRKYAPLLAKCRARSDLDYVIGEMIGELGASHAGIDRFGDSPGPQSVPPVGYLGVDFRLQNGAYQIERIVEGAPWDTSGRGPLSQPAVDIREGDYLLAVDGKPLDPSKAPWAAFEDLAGKAVTLTVSARPIVDASARRVAVTTLASERDLRYHAWVEANRSAVERQSGGKIGYLHVPSFANTELGTVLRQFYGQTGKTALIVDVRWNNGGLHSDAVIELLNRPVLDYLIRRHSVPMPIPQRSHGGSKCLLINHQTASSGESFAYYFRAAGLGKLVGGRTRGMLTGNEDRPVLMDGGAFRTPQFGTFGPDGRWLPEGRGVKPDLMVEEDPAAFNRGEDVQLLAAVRLLTKVLKTTPTSKLVRPTPLRGQPRRMP